MSLTDDINAISDRVFALEQENEQLKQQPVSEPFNKEYDEILQEAVLKIQAHDKLIDLLSEDILWWEKNLTEKTSDKMKSIVAAYRAVRPVKK